MAGFRIVAERGVAEAELKLLDALEPLKREYRLEQRREDMAAKIRAAIDPIVPLLADPDPWLFWESDPLGTYHEELEALRQRPDVRTGRKARQIAKFIFDDRKNLRGAPVKINEALVMTLVSTIEEIAGRPLSYKRWRVGKNARGVHSGSRTSGPPEGPMLDVLMAGIGWAHFLATQLTTSEGARRIKPPEREGVLSLIKRRNKKQN